MIFCDACSEAFDTDDDPECFFDTPDGEQIICQGCRDHADMVETQESITAEMQQDFYNANRGMMH